jgi:hypothetical protein
MNYDAYVWRRDILRQYKNKYIVLFLTVALFAIANTFEINIYYVGFALDDNGLLYVGKQGRIDVYSDGEFTSTIFRTNDGYWFTFQDEQLYIIRGSNVRIFDLSGNLIETIDDREIVREWNRVRNVESRKQSTFTTGHNDYREASVLGFYRIVKVTDYGNEVIFQMPTFDYVCKISIVLTGVMTLGLTTMITLQLMIGYTKEQR